jgi:uncharacterized LabA/DUF88 family protein
MPGLSLSFCSGLLGVLMSKRQAIVFIDGNNLYHNLKSFSVKPGQIDLSKLSESVCRHFECEMKAVRYYNSIPSINDGKETYERHMHFLDRIASLPKFTVHTRKLQPKTRKEKGIDVMIAVDMLNLCVLRNECDCCILISGDTDFIHSAEIIKSYGKEVLSAFIPRGYSTELREKLRFFVMKEGFLKGNCLKES